MNETAPSGGNSAAAPSSSPTTFEQAFAADASPASEPSQQSNDATAAVQPASAESSPQQTDERSPFIPRARFDEVVSARQKAEEQLGAWKGYDWARSVTPEQFQQMAHWYQTANADPVAFAQNLISELQNHPTHGQALRSLAAKALASGRGQSAPEMPSPDVAITDGQGNVIGHTYSDKAQQQRDQWLISQVLQQVEQKYQPVTKTVEEITKERAEQKTQQEAASFADGFYKELSALPHFKEHAAAIKEELSRVQLSSDHPAEVKAAALQAYAKIVLPKVFKTAQSQLLDTLTQKAAASTGVNPGSAAPSSPSNITRFDDPRLAWR